MLFWIILLALLLLVLIGGGFAVHSLGIALLVVLVVALAVGVSSRL